MRKMSAEQVADLLNVDLRTLRNWESEGTGPKRVREGGKPAYPVKNLREWLRRNRPDVKLGKAPALSPAQREAEREEARRAKAWDDFFAEYYPDGYLPGVAVNK